MRIRDWSSGVCSSDLAAIAQAEADLNAANANAAFAASGVERDRPLAADGAETRERLSELQNQAIQARARAAAARATLTSAQKRIATLQTQEIGRAHV